MSLKLLISGLMVFGIVGCSSFQKDEVISRMDNIGERPSWATLKRTTYTSGGKMYAIGIAEGGYGANLSALGRIADNNSKSELSRLVSNKVGVAFQNVEEGTGGTGLSRFVGTEKSYVNTSDIIPEKRYWEKVKTHDEDGQVKMVTRMFSLTSIEQHKLRKLIKRQIASESGISKELKEKVDNQLDDLLEE